MTQHFSKVREVVGQPPFHRAGLLNGSNMVQYGMAAVVVVLVVAPLLPIIYQSFLNKPLYDTGGALTFRNYTDLVGSETLWRVIYNSLVFSLLTTLIAQVLGVFFAIIVGRTDLPGRRIFGEILLWPLYVSGLVLAFGYFIVYGPAGYVTLQVSSLFGGVPWSLYTISGMALVAGISQMPLSMLYCLGSTAMSNAVLEDAARSCGANPWRTMRSITLPLLRPALVYSGLLNFTIALEMLSIPLIFGEPAKIQFFTTLLYTQGVSTPVPNYGLVGTGAVILLVIVTGLVFLQNKLLQNSQRFVTVSGKASRPKTLPLGSWRWPTFFMVALYTLLFVVLPIGMLMLRGFVSFLSPYMPIWNLFTLNNFQTIFAYPAYTRSILNSIMVATGGAAMATVFITLVAIIVQRSEFKYKRQLEYFALLPRAIPGIVAGLGFFYAMVLLPPLGWLRNGIGILIVTYLMRYIPTGFGAVAPVLMQISPDIDRAARVSGASWFTTVRTVVAPLVLPAMFTCFAILFMHFFKEYSAAIFLFAPGSEVIGTTLIQFWVQGSMGGVAALATIQIVIMALFVFAVRRFLKVRIYG